MAESRSTRSASAPAYVDSILCDERGIAVRLEASRVEAFEVTSGKVLGAVPVPPGTKVVRGYSFQLIDAGAR